MQAPAVAGELYEYKCPQRRPYHHYPQRKRRQHIGIKSVYDFVIRAMDEAVQYAKSEKLPGRNDVEIIHCATGKQVQANRIKKNGQLEQVLEVV